MREEREKYAAQKVEAGRSAEEETTASAIRLRESEARIDEVRARADAAELARDEAERRASKAEAAREGTPPWEQFADEAPEVQQLAEVLKSTMGAVQQVFRAGTPAQQAKAVVLLTETRRQLYEVLASPE